MARSAAHAGVNHAIQEAAGNSCRPLKRTRLFPLLSSQHFRAGLSYIALRGWRRIFPRFSFGAEFCDYLSTFRAWARVLAKDSTGAVKTARCPGLRDPSSFPVHCSSPPLLLTAAFRKSADKETEGCRIENRGW